jgi:hypothetical protein
MTFASYERQHLSVYAAGFIDAAGSVKQGFGCQMTRVGQGIYAVVFGADDGLVNNQSFTFVTPKGSSTAVATTVMVEDTSNTVKTIFVRTGTTVFTDTDIEVAVFRTVTSE